MTENKESWYPSPDLSELEKKYCRCLLEAADNELQRYGYLRSQSTWAICSASVTHKSQSSKGKKQRQKLQKTSLGANCTTYLNVNSLPTRLLYAYIKLREKKFLTNLSFRLPEAKIFYKDPEHYRTSLLIAIREYIREERTRVKNKT